MITTMTITIIIIITINGLNHTVRKTSSALEPNTVNLAALINHDHAQHGELKSKILIGKESWKYTLFCFLKKHVMMIRHI